MARLDGGAAAMTNTGLENGGVRAGEAARRPWPRRLVLAANVGFGGWALASGTGHFVAVLAGILGRTPVVYDYRAYSLLLLGVAIAAPGLAGALATRGLWRGAPGAFGLAVAMTVSVLVVTAAALPLQITFLPFGAAANLAALAIGRATGLLPRAGAAPTGTSPPEASRAA